MQYIETEIRGNTFIIKLNNTEKKNAFNKKMLQQWLEALKDAESLAHIRTILLTGNGSAFCSGGDISDMNSNQSSLEIKNYLWDEVQQIAFQMEKIDIPIICAINGIAVGAGLDMALMADIRFMSKEARISEGYINLGIAPGDGGAYYLPRIIGYSNALTLMLLGEMIDAPTAKKLGIVSEVFELEELFDEALAFCEKINQKPPQAAKMIKRLLKQSLTNDLKTSLDLASSQVAILMKTKDHEEAVDAFFNKRKPIFIGE